LALAAGVIEAGTLTRLGVYRILEPVQSVLGPVLIGFGLALRVCAMTTAKANFNHLVVHDFKCKHPDHELVTTGIYRLFRHPAYLGFWLFAVGGQVTLGSWCCASLYALVLHKFFRERIVVEEAALLCRYPGTYPRYREHTWSGLPFIR
jgi:protein-S-isoprenylcysteine O-methyltransferase